jgi:hypothetical protein
MLSLVITRSHRFPGVVIPVLPQREMKPNRFEASFVDIRRKALARFLQFIGYNTVLRESRPFGEFLRSGPLPKSDLSKKLK